MNKKGIRRDFFINIKVSKQEKELFETMAKTFGIQPSTLARNILMYEAEQKLRNKIIYKPLIDAYKTYLKLTNQENELERILGNKENKEDQSRS